MTTIGEMMGEQRQQDGSWARIQQPTLDDQSQPQTDPSKYPSMQDLIAGKATVYDDGSFEYHDLPPPPAASTGYASWQSAYDVLLNLGMGAGSGVEIAGALTELAMPETGDKIRMSGRSVEDYFREKMSPEMQAALDRSWTDFSKEGALADPRSYIAAVAQAVPYMLGTGGAGEAAALGARGLGLAGREVGATVGERAASAAGLRTAERKIGYGAAAGAAGAGEAAQGAAQATDEAGLDSTQREEAMWAAAPFGAAAGLVVGPKLEKLLHGAGGAGIVGRVGQSAAIEIGEEGGTQFGTEVGKSAVGLDFDAEAVAGAMIAGGVMGVGAGAIIGHPGSQKFKDDQKKAKAGVAEAQAILSEANRQKDETDVAQREAVEANRQKQANAPLALPAPAPGPTPPLDVGAEQFQQPGAPTLPGQPQKNLGAVAPAAETPLDTHLGLGQYNSEAGNAYYTQLATNLSDREAQLGELQAQIAQTVNPGERVRLTAKFREARAAQQEAQRLFDQFDAKAKALSNTGKRKQDLFAVDGQLVQGGVKPSEQLPLGDILEEGTPGDINHAAIAAMDQQEQSDELDKWFNPRTDLNPAGFAEPLETDLPDQERPLDKALRLKIERSQRALRGHETRRQNQAALNKGPLAPIQAGQDTLPPSPQPPPSMAGSAEAAAIRHLTPANQDAPSVPQRNAAAFSAPSGSLPEPPPSASGPGPQQGDVRPPSAVAQPGTATVAPSPAPSSQPTPQRGGITQPASAQFADEIPADNQMQYRDPTAIVGSDEPASMMPQIEQALTQKTKPRQKSLAKLTPRERLIKILSDGPKSVDTVLAHLQDAFQNSGDNRAFRLIQKLRAALPAGKTTGVVVEARSLGQGFQGLYDPRVDRIYIDTAQAEDVVIATLHETVHAATLYKMRTNTKFRGDILRYMNDARAMWVQFRSEPIDQDAALHDPEEFIARVLTDFDFADKIAALPSSAEEMSRTAWQRIKMRLSVAFGMRQDKGISDIFDMMMEFIPDGTFLQDGNRQEIMTQLDNLGLSQPVASMLSGFRSMLRQVQTNPQQIIASAPGKFNRVREWLLPTYTVQQMVTSFGNLGYSWTDKSGTEHKLAFDAINQYAKLNDQRDGYAESLRAVADRIIGVGKKAAQDAGDTAAVDTVLMNARRWSLDPDKPNTIVGGRVVPHPDNQRGFDLPGGPLLLADLQQQFMALRPMQKDFFRLVRDNSAAQRYDYINQVMLYRVAARLEKDPAKQAMAIKALTTLIYHPGRVQTNINPTSGVGPSGVTIKYQKPLNAVEVKAFVNTLGLNMVEQRQLYKDLRQITTAMGKDTGVYIPLRRVGRYYSMLRSANFTPPKPMTRTEFNNLVATNQRNEGDLDIVDEGFDKKTMLYSPTLRHITVTAHDSESEAEADLAAQKENWRTRGITSLPEYTRAALKRGNLWPMLGIPRSSVEGLRSFLETKMPGATGQKASEMALNYYLEKLPESSVQKSRLHARKIKGADRDSLHTYANYSNGAAYLSAQMKYGADINKLLSKGMSTDIQTLITAGQGRQANDYQKLQNFLNRLSNGQERLASQDASTVENKIAQYWKRAPQLAGAWLLTGPGTTIANAFQGWQIGLPYLGARYGLRRSGMEMMRAYKDIVRPITKETGAEGWRAIKGLPGAAKVAVSGFVGGKQKFTTSIKDEKQTMWEKATAHLPAEEQQYIRDLAHNKKIDFGLTADIKSLSERAGGLWTASQYLMDAAFIIPQATETMNRMMIGLATYRLHQQTATNQVMADASILPKDKAAAIQQRLLDEGAKAIDNTQWNYSASNRSLIMQQEWLRQASVFKTYPQHLWYSLTHNMLQAMRAKTPAEKKIAIKFIGGMLATTMIGSGLIGVLAFDPFYLAAVMLTKLFTDDDDPEEALRHGMQEYLGEWTDLMLRGASQGFGGPDTVNRLGFPSLFPVQAMVAQARPGDKQTPYEKLSMMVGEAIMGAPGSLIGQQVTAAAKASANGDYATAAEKMSPSMFSGIIQAWNMHNRGLVDSTGATYVGSKDMAWTDVAARALGFDTAEMSQQKSIRREFFRQDDKLTIGRQGLIADYAEAQMARDKAARTKALTAIRDWNHKNRGYGITRQSLEQSTHGQQKNEQLVARYGVRARTPGQRKLLETIRSNYNA